MQQIANHLHVLILQHPQEPGVELGSAHILETCLAKCTLKVGLSWANLSKALGRSVDPKQWAVLYRGTGLLKASEPLPDASALYFVSKKGNPVPAPESQLEGIVVLDGTWSQAKAMWWRNPWLLKLRRVVLVPKSPSLYGKKRKEPQKDCVSTLESVAEVLVALGEPTSTHAALVSQFAEFLKK